MSLTVFTYHRVLPQAHPDALTTDLFKQQLDFLQKNFELLSPAEALSYIKGEEKGAGGKRKAMLSFDDGWLDNWLYATPILKERNLKAALALSAGFLHDGEVREQSKVPYEIVARRNMDAEKNAPQGDTLCYLNRAEVLEMHKSGAWSIEAHGTKHLKNSLGISSIALPDKAVPVEKFEAFLQADLKNCIDEISRICGNAPKMMFWPWGHYSEISAKLAGTMGFQAQFTTAKGSIRFGDKRSVFPRVNAAAKWEKFTRNAQTFSRPILARLHDIFAHTEKLCFVPGDTKL